jgi:hypothetical protein
LLVPLSPYPLRHTVPLWCAIRRSSTANRMARAAAAASGERAGCGFGYPNPSRFGAVNFPHRAGNSLTEFPADVTATPFGDPTRYRAVSAAAKRTVWLASRDWKFVSKVSPGPSVMSVMSVKPSLHYFFPPARVFSSLTSLTFNRNVFH